LLTRFSTRSIISALILEFAICENAVIRRRQSAIICFSALGAAVSIIPDPEPESDLIGVLERAIVLALSEQSELTVLLLRMALSHEMERLKKAKD
jgi:hypothetical protein